MKKLLILCVLLAGCAGKDDNKGEAAAQAQGASSGGGGEVTAAAPGAAPLSTDACAVINGDFAREAQRLHVETERNGSLYRYRLSANGDWFNANVGTVTTTSGTVHEVRCTESLVEFRARANGGESVLKITLVSANQIDVESDGTVISLARVNAPANHLN